jgi:hypothetical protein
MSRYCLENDTYSEMEKEYKRVKEEWGGRAEKDEKRRMGRGGREGEKEERGEEKGREREREMEIGRKKKKEREKTIEFLRDRCVYNKAAFISRENVK